MKINKIKKIFRRKKNNISILKIIHKFSKKTHVTHTNPKQIHTFIYSIDFQYLWSQKIAKTRWRWVIFKIENNVEEGKKNLNKIFEIYTKIYIVFVAAFKCIFIFLLFHLIIKWVLKIKIFTKKKKEGQILIIPKQLIKIINKNLKTENWKKQKKLIHLFNIRKSRIIRIICTIRKH